MSKTIPTIFKPAMVRAILREIAYPGSGKTQTRRLDLHKWRSLKRGDTIWVRENWGCAPELDFVKPRDLPEKTPCIYTPALEDHIARRTGAMGKQRPSIHLPYEFRRIELEVISVREEALQAIGAVDAEAEGVIYETADPPFYYVPHIMPHSLTAVGCETMLTGHAVASFRKLWDLINGESLTGRWTANPTVARIEFKPLLVTR